MNDVVEFLWMFIQSLLAQIESLKTTVKSLNDTIKTLEQTIESLKQTIAKQNEKLNKDSHNSSKPPSTDGLKKPKVPNLRTKSDKKPGAQKGHKGTTLFSDLKPDETKQHMPSECVGCPHYSVCYKKAKVGETRKVIDIILDTKVTAHESLVIRNCLKDNRQKRGEFPEDVTGPIQYGSSLRAFVVSLNTVGAVSINRIHEILGEVFDIPLSTGVIANMVSDCAEKVRPTVQKIKEAIVHAAMAHFDETTVRVEKTLHYIHVACTDTLAYFFGAKSRSYNDMEKAGILGRFLGIAIHDCYTAYWKFKNIAKHAVCNVHILRELVGVEENTPNKTSAKKMKELLYEMKRIRDAAILKGDSSLAAETIQRLEKEYDEIIEKAKKEYQPPPRPMTRKKGKPAKGKALSLFYRLEAHKGEVCLFLHDFSVPFTNNDAERMLRPAKTKMKVCGCFRAHQGLVDYCDIMSYVNTCRKNGTKTYSAILQAVTGNISLNI